MPTLHLPCPISEVSDGHHTFGELYEHRCLLFVALMRAHPSLSWRARKQDDGGVEAGWWIGGMDLPTGPITYHLPDTFWTLLDGADLRTLDHAPAWDGHTSTDVLARLRSWLDDPRA